MKKGGRERENNNENQQNIVEIHVYPLVVELNLNTAHWK